MKVTLLLTDYAQVADGKLTIVGGGWTVTGPGPVPFGIAMLVEVPWDQTNTKHSFHLELVDTDGEPVLVPTPEGDKQLSIDGEFEAGRPPGTKPGSAITIPMAINLSGQPIPPGGRYEWRLSIDGQTDDDWRLSFTTRPEAQSQAL